MSVINTSNDASIKMRDNNRSQPTITSLSIELINL